MYVRDAQEIYVQDAQKRKYNMCVPTAHRENIDVNKL